MAEMANKFISLGSERKQWNLHGIQVVQAFGVWIKSYPPFNDNIDITEQVVKDSKALPLLLNSLRCALLCSPGGMVSLFVNVTE